FSLASTPGLVSFAAAVRSGGEADLVWRHVQRLAGGLPVVVAPSDAEQVHAALSSLVADPAGGLGVLRAMANRPGTVVVVDCGRVDPGSPALLAVRVSDTVVLLSKAHAEDLAHLPRRLPAVGRWSPHPVLLLVGEGYGEAEIARELGVNPLGRVPHDPQGAAVLCGRPAAPRRRRHHPSRSALGRYAHEVAVELATRQQTFALVPHRTDPASPPTPAAALDMVPGIPPAAISPYGLRPAPDALRGGRVS
ncbi:chromosome partitioning protein, partial [Actinosynnema sp. NPDC059797]